MKREVESSEQVQYKKQTRRPDSLRTAPGDDLSLQFRVQSGSCCPGQLVSRSVRPFHGKSNMPIEYVTEGVPRPRLPYSPAVKAGPWTYISGQASVDEQGEIVAGTFKEEFERTLANLQKVLTAAGLTMRDIVKVTSYVGTSENLEEYNRLYREAFSEPFPARTTIVNCLQGVGIQYEIDVIAYRDA